MMFLVTWTAKSALENVPVVAIAMYWRTVALFAIVIRAAWFAADSAAVVMPATAANAELSAESHSAIVTDVPANANSWTYIWAPNDSDPPVLKLFPDEAAVAEESTRRPGVSWTPHSRPNPFATASTANVRDPS